MLMQQPTKAPVMQIETEKELERTWIGLKDVSSSCATESFSAMQWNVLADGLAQHGNFCKVPEDLLTWESRWPRISHHLLQHRPDILCMQEVNHYDNSYAPFLESAGYIGAYTRKNSRPSSRLDFDNDGSAICWQSSRFVALEPHTVRRFQGPDGKPENQVLLSVRLQCKQSGSIVRVVCLHLKAKYGLLEQAQRVRQITQTMAFIDEVSGGHTSEGTEGAGANSDVVLLLGDFNAEPASECCQRIAATGRFTSIWDTAGKQLMYAQSKSDTPLDASSSPTQSINGTLHSETSVTAHSRLRSNSSDDKHDDGAGVGSRRNSTDSDTVPHVLRLGSHRAARGVFASDVHAVSIGLAPQEGGLFSTFKFRSTEAPKKALIDYVWYDHAGLVLDDVLSMPTEEEIGVEGLPNGVFPSDHVSVVCRLKFVDKGL